MRRKRCSGFALQGPALRSGSIKHPAAVGSALGEVSTPHRPVLEMPVVACVFSSRLSQSGKYPGMPGGGGCGTVKGTKVRAGIGPPILVPDG